MLFVSYIGNLGLFQTSPLSRRKPGSHLKAVPFRGLENADTEAFYKHKRGKMLRSQNGAEAVETLDALVCSGQAGVKDLSSELVGGVFLRENSSGNHQTDVICIRPCPDTIPMLLIEAVSTPL